ncbi:MAG: M6 family metalloprotease domain-containing protein [Armatimonadota bacterium]
MIRTVFSLRIAALFFCITICLQIGAGPASAIPAMPGRIQIVQPNGFIINSYIKGDEFQNWTEAQDGYSIIRNSQNNYWYYAVKNLSGNLVPSGTIYLPNAIRPQSIIAHIKPDRNFMAKPVPTASKGISLSSSSSLWAPIPSSGEKKILIVMVEFQDREFITTPQSWYDAFFDTTPGVKSMANFYKDNSRGKVSIVPLASSQPSLPSGVVKIKMSGNHPNIAGSFNYYTEVDCLNEVLSLVTPYVDFSALDTNTNGILENTEASMYYVFAGYEASGTNLRPSIWAHAWQNFDGYPSVIVDGVQVTPWALNGELDNYDQHMSIGVHTHESAHQIFRLPDLYDISNTNEGIGVFSLMGIGSWGFTSSDSQYGATPVNMDAWSRQFTGWTTPRIPMAQGVMTFGAATAADDSPVKLADPRVSDLEYFLVENRPLIGWDEGMFLSFGSAWAGGLLVLHVDENIGDPFYNNLNEYHADSHQGVLVEEASTAYGSLMDGSTYGLSDHLFYNGNNTSFLSSTVPNSLFYDSTNIGVGISNVSVPSSSMTANVIPCPPVATPTFTPDTGTYSSTQSVTINCATAGASIRYTTNGDIPTSGSTLYTGAVSIDHSLTLKAIAMYNGVPSSAVKSAVYTFPSGSKPDMLIKTGIESSYSGTDVFNADGTNQSKSQNAAPNQKVIFVFKVKNSGDASDSFKITGPAGGSGWSVKYFDLSTNADVTSQVTGSGWTSGALAIGASKGIYVNVKPDATVAVGSTKALLMTAASETDSNAIDVVKATTSFIGTYKTDMLIKSGVEATYSGLGTFSTDGNNQTKSQNVSSGQKIIFAFRAQNAGNAYDSFRITGPAGGSGWSVKYYDLTTNAEVTSQVTGAGWVSGLIAPRTNKGVYANIKPDATVPVGSTITLVVTAVSESDNTKLDVVKAITTCINTYQPDILIKNGADASYIGAGILNADGTNQTKSQYASAGQKAIYSFRVMNAGFLSDSFNITGTTGGNGWSVKYYDLASVDITSQVTGSGWLSGTVAPGTDMGFFMKVSPDGTLTSGSVKTVFITATSVGGSTKKDVAKAVTTVP